MQAATKWEKPSCGGSSGNPLGARWSVDVGSAPQHDFGGCPNSARLTQSFLLWQVVKLPLVVLAHREKGPRGIQEFGLRIRRQAAATLLRLTSFETSLYDCTSEYSFANQTNHFNGYSRYEVALKEEHVHFWGSDSKMGVHQKAKYELTPKAEA